MDRHLLVLVVDDKPDARENLALLLRLEGHDVVQAADGPQAVRAASRERPDVVLLDWQLVEMSGPEFVRQVRSPGKFSHPNVPIIMLVGHGEPSRVIEAMRLGVHGFLVKPVSGEALCERLASCSSRWTPVRRAARSTCSYRRNGRCSARCFCASSHYSGMGSPEAGFARMIGRRHKGRVNQPNNHSKLTDSNNCTVLFLVSNLLLLLRRPSSLCLLPVTLQCRRKETGAAC